VSSRRALADWIAHHLVHLLYQLAAVALLIDLLMTKQSQDAWLASAADAALGSVQQQYHLELRRFPV